jgi:hypothetical protein
MSDEKPITISTAPRFCPDCGRSGGWSSQGPLCDHCGATLATQGYCPVCESRLRRRIGALCPKHDVELLPDEGEPPRIPFRDSAVSWVTVKRFPDTLAASGARIRLDAEGIPTFLEGERMGAPAMYRVATGGVKLQVPAELAADARVILSQDWSWPSDELDSDEDRAIDEDGLPPAEADYRRRLLIEVTLVLSLAIPLIAALLAYLR